MAILFEMNERSKEQMEEYGIVFEEKSAVLQELKIRYGKTYRKAVATQRRADSAFMKKNYKEAIKLYNEYLDVCDELMKEANSIPDTNVKDFIQLLIPLYNSLIAGSIAGHMVSNKMIFKNDASIKDGPREYAKGLVKNYKQYGKNQISKCKEKM